jgi:hypothetical protein
MSTEAEMAAPDYERSDASVGGVALSLGIVAFGIAAGMAACAIFYTGRHAHELPPRPLGGDASFHHGPDERTSIQQDWVSQDAAVWTHLHSYGWVDRAHEIVRVPIDRAIELEVRAAERSEKAPPKGAEEKP